MPRKPVKCVVIQPDGKNVAAEFASLKELQKLVGGYIEGVRLGPSTYAYVNEEGKLKGATVNSLATAIYHIGGDIQDVICGPMVVCGAGDNNGNDTDIPPNLRNSLLVCSR